MTSLLPALARTNKILTIVFHFTEYVFKNFLQNDICIRRTAEFYMESHYCHQNEEVNTYIATERNSVITDDITDVHNMRMWVKPVGFSLNHLGVGWFKIFKF